MLADPYQLSSTPSLPQVYLRSSSYPSLKPQILSPTQSEIDVATKTVSLLYLHTLTLAALPWVPISTLVVCFFILTYHTLLITIPLVPAQPVTLTSYHHSKPSPT